MSNKMRLEEFSVSESQFLRTIKTLAGNRSGVQSSLRTSSGESIMQEYDITLQEGFLDSGTLLSDLRNRPRGYMVALEPQIIQSSAIGPTRSQPLSLTACSHSCVLGVVYGHCFPGRDRCSCIHAPASCLLHYLQFISRRGD